MGTALLRRLGAAVPHGQLAAFTWTPWVTPFPIPPPLYSTQLERRHTLPFICQVDKRGKCWFANF